MIPKLAHSSGINPAYLSIPMLQASNLGRTISPVSGVVVAVAGMAKNFAVRSGETDLCPGAGWFVSGDYRHRSSGSRQRNPLTLKPCEKAPVGAFLSLITQCYQ